MRRLSRLDPEDEKLNAEKNNSKNVGFHGRTYTARGSTCPKSHIRSTQLLCAKNRALVTLSPLPKLLRYTDTRLLRQNPPPFV